MFGLAVYTINDDGTNLTNLYHAHSPSMLAYVGPFRGMSTVEPGLYMLLSETEKIATPKSGIESIPSRSLIYAVPVSRLGVSRCASKGVTLHGYTCN